MSEAQGTRAMWVRLSRSGRWSLVGVSVLVVTAVLVAGYWGLRSDYRVLFSQLSSADAGAVIKQLKHQKTPYRLTDGGATVWVPADQVYESRLTLMSSGASLGGGVGFELFDNQSLGSTEQSQRVSYQRALQGELARTIGAVDQVRQARVHLVLPETSLFKRDRVEARAAVSLSLANGATLRREQVSGIQRLVAAAVQGLDASRVVIMDQQGVVLSMTDATGAGGGSEMQLALKREVEDYFVAKIGHLLDSTYGAGRALVSVDAALNFDAITRTQQEVLPIHAGDNGAVVRRLQQNSTGEEGRATSDAFVSDGGDGNRNSSSQVDYEYSHRAEQVVTSPGSLARLSVGIVVPRSIAIEQQQRIQELVRAAAGLNMARGDAIVVQAIDQLGGAGVSGSAALLDPTAAVTEAVPVTVATRRTIMGRAPSRAWIPWQPWMPWAALAASLGLLSGLGLRSRALRAAKFREATGEGAPQRRLSGPEREELLRVVKKSLAGAPPSKAGVSL